MAIDENKTKENSERPSEDEKAETKGEERLYEPIRNLLRNIFANYYVEKPRKPQYQNALSYEREENPYLEIIGKKKSFSQALKREFNTNTLLLINSEGSFPDLVGYVRKKPSNPTKEIVVVEIKDKPVKLIDIFQARLYQEIFSPTFCFLISSEEIPEERIRFVEKRDFIRGEVIIAQYHENPYQKYGFFNIHPIFKNSVPEAFKKFCIS
jgi:hypothetical protein